MTLLCRCVCARVFSATSISAFSTFWESSLVWRKKWHASMPALFLSADTQPIGTEIKRNENKIGEFPVGSWRRRHVTYRMCATKKSDENSRESAHGGLKSRGAGDQSRNMQHAARPGAINWRRAATNSHLYTRAPFYKIHHSRRLHIWLGATCLKYIMQPAGRPREIILGKSS